MPKTVKKLCHKSQVFCMDYKVFHIDFPQFCEYSTTMIRYVSDDLTFITRKQKCLLCNSELSFLTNSSWIPFITERVQRLKEVRHVKMMRQSNSTVRFMFLAAERTQKSKVVTNKQDTL